MRVAVYSNQKYDENFLLKEPFAKEIDFSFFDTPLNEKTVALAIGHDAINCFVNDDLCDSVLRKLADFGIKHVSLRCAGFNNVDIDTANALGITISRVPAYGPEAVAEHTIALLLSLNRKTHKAYNRVKEGNFSLEGLLGFNISGKTVGIIGTGKIGVSVIKILKGFGASVLCFDPFPSEQAINLGAQYCELDTLLESTDVISLHCPLTPTTKHLINAQSLAKMKNGVVILNTSRGGLIDTQAIISGLKSKKISALGLDVYEMESELFFQDHSLDIIQDDIFQRLLTFPNVIITGHQGFFTEQAMAQIAATTVSNLLSFSRGNLAPENCITGG